jgi:hypothetical protein
VRLWIAIPKRRLRLSQEVKPFCLTLSAEARLLSMLNSAFVPGPSRRISIHWNLVQPLTDSEMFPYDRPPDPPNPSELLNQLLVLKLNGGLGTTIGCQLPKSLIVCQNGQRFFGCRDRSARGVQFGVWRECPARFDAFVLHRRPNEACPGTGQRP